MTAGPGDQLAAYVSAVLMRHVRQEHRNGRRVPDGVVALALDLSSGGQRRPILDTRAGRRDAPSMPPLAVDYATAAAALGVSPRTIRRRVAAGALPVVGTGTGRRIPAAALAAYAQERP